MKKKIIVLLIVFMLGMTVNPISTYADSEPGMLYDFYDEDVLQNYYETSVNMRYEISGNALYFISTNGPDTNEGVGDPFMVFNTDNFDGDTYYWLKIRIMNLSEATRFQMHFGTNGAGITGASNTLFEISAGDTEFKEYIIDLKQANFDTFPISSAYSNIGNPTETLWQGTITKIRFDFLFVDFPGGQVNTGSEFYMEYAAFFDSEEAAIAYTGPDHTPAPTKAPTAVPTEAPATAVPTNTPTPSATPTITPADEEESGSSNKPLIIGACIAGAVIVCAVVVILLVRKKK